MFSYYSLWVVILAQRGILSAIHLSTSLCKSFGRSFSFLNRSSDTYICLFVMACCDDVTASQGGEGG